MNTWQFGNLSDQTLGFFRLDSKFTILTSNINFY